VSVDAKANHLLDEMTMTSERDKLLMQQDFRYSFYCTVCSAV